MTDPRAPTADETELLEFVDRTGKDVAPLGPPGVWHDFGEGLGDAAMQGLARTGRAAAVAGAVPAIAFDKLHGDTTAQDWYFENVVDPTSDAVDAWTPNAAHVGAAGQALNGLTSALIPLAVGGGNPVPLLGTVALDTPVDLLDKGASLGSSIGVAGIQTLATAAGFKLPAAWGSNLLSRLGTGAGGNLAIGAASRDLSARALDAGGSPDLADQYGGDATAAVLDVGMGLAFGALAHAQAPRVTRAQRDAVLTTNNAHHFENETAPGTPADQASAAAHVTALETAVRQLLDGEAVNLADAIPDAGLAFVPRARAPGAALGALAEGAAPGAFDAAVADVLKAEGGFVDDPADRGGATKFGISSRAHPGVDVASLTQDQARAIYRRDYWDAIDADQLPADLRGAAFDAAVNQGVGWTRRALAEADGDPAAFLKLREQHYRDIVANDPTQAKFLRGWLNRLGRFKETNDAGRALRERLIADPEQLTRDYAALEDSKGGTVLNTDTGRELSAEYLGDRTRSADVHEAASDTIKTIYEAKLAQPTPAGFEPTVLFTAGGTGAGKTTAIKAAGEAFGKPEIVYDTNMNTLASAVDKIEQALAAGREVDIAYVYRDPVESLTAGAIPRAVRQMEEFGSGRTVPLEEHARTHIGVRPVIEALAEKYRGDDRVHITAIDNSRGKGNSVLAPLESLPRVEDTTLRERLEKALEEARTGGLDEALVRGFQAAGRDPQRAGNPPRAGDGGRPEPGNGGEVTPDSFATAANDAVAEFPDLLIADADGNVRPAAEFLQDIQATTAQAEVQARALDAAVNCFLRSGT